MSELRESLARVHDRIESSCRKSGRDPSSVTLIAVSKTVDTARIAEALAAGHAVFGENRVQEALGKIPEVGEGARWHLVGHLQRNKARHAVGAFELIHSVDGPSLAAELDRRAAAAGLVQRVLVQLNLAEEASKHGLRREGLEPLIETMLTLDHLDVRGLMTIPPPVESPEDNRRWFALLREARESCAARFGRPFPELSMGMTDDFEVAVEEGATLVRVGRAIFGERD